ncbi:TerD family protein [Nocardia concava]|uniref:TerD family protein n=1 Tax=Nocardia concava TaxID=257281 RepID=UPI0002EA7951|nr:TerD family protein [Nocardia concava]
MSVPLCSAEGAPLECLAVGLGWEPSLPSVDLGLDQRTAVTNRFDLNLAALLFSSDQLVDVVFYDHLASADGSVRHSGDDLTGEGLGDNETIIIDIPRIAPSVSAVMFVVSSYTARPFTDIPNAYCHVTDAASRLEVARYALTGGPYTAYVVGKLTRTPDMWFFAGIGAGVAATHVAETVPYLSPYLP